MSYETFTEYNSSDASGLFLYTAEVVPEFIPLVLFALFCISLMATYFSQRRLTGRGDFLSSFAAAGFFVAIVAFVMTLVEGLINTFTLVVCVVVALIGVILLLVSRND